MYVDIPTAAEFRALAERRADACVSIYLPTTPLTQNTDASRIELRNLSRDATQQLRRSAFDKRRLSALEQELQELTEDDEFWRFQANSLAVLATPDDLVTYRLPNNLRPRAEVSDRFHLAPIVRTLSFPYSTFVLAISQGAVRLVEVTETMAAEEADVPGLPRDLSAATGRAMPRDRAPTGRLQGDEGQKVLIGQFSRAVDRAIRAYLGGQTQPLILAGVEYVLAIYRSVNSYPALLSEQILGNVEELPARDLAENARAILSREYQHRVHELQTRFGTLRAQGRGATELREIALAATQGAIDTLLFDIDSAIDGQVDDFGNVFVAASPNALSYDVVAEVSARVLANGGKVVGVRASDLAPNVTAIALLRYPIEQQKTMRAAG